MVLNTTLLLYILRVRVMVLNTTFTIPGVTFASGDIYYGLELWCLTPLSQFHVLHLLQVIYNTG